MRKIVALLVVALAAFAAAASAHTNKPDGTVVHGTNVGNIAMSGIITCTSSTISGDLKNLTVGATVSFTSVAFSNCGSGNTVVACNLPWDLPTTATTDGGTTWHGRLTGVCVDITTVLTGTCRYTGSLTKSYSEATDRLSVSTNQALTNNQGFPCPATGTVTATYATTPTDLDIT